MLYEQNGKYYYFVDSNGRVEKKEYDPVMYHRFKW
jgi:hypothetical protein